MIAFDVRWKRAALLALVLVHLGIIARQVDAGAGLTMLDRIVLTLVGPLQGGIARLVRGAASTWDGYLDLRNVRQENLRIRDRVRSLEMQLQERQALAQEAERLRGLLQLTERQEPHAIPAQVVTRDGLPWARTLTINRGRHHGVRLDAPVIATTGLVGRVIGLGAGLAKVQLLQDRDSGAAVLVERSRVEGVVAGQVGQGEGNTNDLQVRYVLDAADVQEGDRVVTSGLDRMYPKGLTVGTVRRALSGSGLFMQITVAPSAPVERLEFVLVLDPVSGQGQTLDETVQ